MATHQPPSGLKQEDEEFVPYEPSLLYPFFLSATAAYMDMVPKVNVKIHEAYQFKQDIIDHPTIQWVDTQRRKLEADKDLRQAAMAGGFVFAALARTKKQPLIIAPVVGGTGAWIAALALFKPESDSLKCTYNWMYKQTRYLSGKKH